MNKDAKENEQQMPWHKSPLVLGMLAVLAIGGGSAAFLNNTAKLRDSVKQQQRESQANIERATTLEIERQRVSEQAAIGAEFARCWPFGICDPSIYPSALPTDSDQNERLDGLEDHIEQLQKFIKSHCQGHRDAGDRYSDCSVL